MSQANPSSLPLNLSQLSREGTEMLVLVSNVCFKRDLCSFPSVFGKASLLSCPAVGTGLLVEK